MLSMPRLPSNKLSCLQVLLPWALVSSAAVLLAASLFSCLVVISVLFADGASVVDTLPTCALMVTVSAVLACIAIHTNLGRRLWLAVWVSSYSLLPQFAYLPVTTTVTTRGCALLSNAAKKRRTHTVVLLLMKEEPEEKGVLCFHMSLAVRVTFCWYQQLSV